MKGGANYHLGRQIKADLCVKKEHGDIKVGSSVVIGILWAMILVTGHEG